MMAKKQNIFYDSGPIAIALIVAAVLFSSAFYFAPARQIASGQQDRQERMIVVSADASRETAPDKVEMIFSVVSQGEDPIAIQAENDAKIAGVISAIAALGIPQENIKTVGYSLDRWSEYNKTQEKYVDMGYRLSNSIRVVSYNVSQAGRIVGEAVQNGANEVSGISFSLADSTQKRIYGSLLQDAAASAKSKAEAMASAAGVRISGLVLMTEGYGYVSPVANYNYREAAFDAKSGGAVPEVSISAGLVKVSATLSAQYELAN